MIAFQRHVKGFAEYGELTQKNPTTCMLKLKTNIEFTHL